MIKILVVVSIAYASLWASPSWYHKLSKKDSSYYIGYGQGSTEIEAKTAALNDISSQISVIVESSISSDMGIKEGSTYKNIEDRSSIRSLTQIHGYTVEELAFEDDKYYMAISYENIPSIDKFNKKIADLYVPEAESYNSYLQETYITTELKRKVDFELERKDSLWYIKYQNILQVLDKKDFSKFFVSTTNTKLSITTNKRNNVLWNEDEFFFKVTSKETGYVTLFTVYEDGTVASLMQNVAIQKETMQNIPDEKYDSVLEAGLIKRGIETFDLYVLVFSKDKKYYDRFARADEALIEDERYKNFDELINMINGRDYVTLKVITKPRM